MKGIYLTQEGKQELEDYLKGLETHLNPETSLYNDGKIDLMKEILSSATVLPVEESWGDMSLKILEKEIPTYELYPQGVIIQPKQ
jgi:hypothetical protein